MPLAGIIHEMGGDPLVDGRGQAWVGHFGGVADSRHNAPFPPQPEVCGWQGEMAYHECGLLSWLRQASPMRFDCYRRIKALAPGH